MKKRIMSLLLAIVLIVSLLPAGAMTALAAPVKAQTKSSGTVTYSVPGGSICFDTETGTVTGYEGEPTKVAIPATINGVPIVAIGDGAFSLCESLTTITFPDSLTSIGDYAFYWCDSLTAITFPDSLTTIGDYAFLNCWCLTDIIFPNSLKTIGKGAFQTCNNMKRVEIPASVTMIGTGAFSHCFLLEGIWVNENNPNYSSDNNGVLFNKNKTELLTFPTALAGSYAIPDSVTAIGDYAFYWCDSLTAITFPDSLTTIGDYAFYWCDSLTAITFPDSLTSIGDDAFSDCDSLTAITFPDSLTSIDNGAFSGCYNLTTITFPDNLTTIGDDAFSLCESLTSVTLPNGLMTIGESAFYGSGLERVDIPATVSTIGPCAFSSCHALEGIWIDENNPNYCSDENGILFNKNKTELLVYPGAFGGGYTVPDGVTTIGDHAFVNCSNLTDIVFPDSLETIGIAAFSDCENLTSITVPDGLKSIGSSAFSYCDNLTSIVLPDSLETIGDRAFEACTSLFSLTIPSGVTTIGDYAFAWCNALERVDIPSNVTTIGPGVFSHCAFLTGIWVSEDNPNYSSGNNGVLFNKNKTELIAYPAALAGSYAIPDSVTTICDSAFGSCCNLAAVAFPDSLKTIGSSAFAYCANLSYFTLPDGVTTIGDFAFEQCHRLENVAIPASVTSIGADVFYHSGLNHIYYGGTQSQWEKLTSISNNEFSYITVHYNETAPWHDCPGNDFADIPFFNNWAHDGIDYCIENELMNGVGNNLFNPNDTVSRAQLVTILYRMAGSPETEFAGTFTDVADGLWYSDAIEWAAATGVVNGVGDGKFAPDQSITREQIATILYRFFGSPAVSGSLSSFPDAGSVRDYAVDGMLWATQEGLINGVSSNGVTTLAPQNNATRAQIAAIIMRYCESTQVA